MWSYYGSKTNIVDLYPPPIHDRIIEPFAGAGKYSLKYFQKDVLLVDKYPDIIEIWKWLQQCSPGDIMGLPILKAGDKIRDFNLDCEAAYLFMGFTIAAGGQTPRNTASPNATTNRPGRIKTRLKKVSENLYKIKHWEFKCCSYDEIPNQSATWFIDPPYEFGGHIYKHSNKEIDFNKLGEWCRHRIGQTIVCENTKATWMDFKPMKQFKGQSHKTTEAIWCNLPNAFDHQQLNLF